MSNRRRRLHPFQHPSHNASPPPAASVHETEHKAGGFTINNVIRQPGDLSPAECSLDWGDFTTVAPAAAVIQTANDLYGCGHAARMMGVLLADPALSGKRALQILTSLKPVTLDAQRLFAVGIALDATCARTWVTIDGPDGEELAVDPDNALDMAQGLMAIAASTETDNLIVEAMREVLKIPEHQISAMLAFLASVRQARDPGFEKLHEAENAETRKADE